MQLPEVGLLKTTTSGGAVRVFVQGHSYCKVIRGKTKGMVELRKTGESSYGCRSQQLLCRANPMRHVQQAYCADWDTRD
jgi:hypothetical protein